jgi:aspartate-semialdehyde dehydrogenase
MKKIAVAILGATGMVGQKFVELLSDHPWFQIVALAASERSQGLYYEDAVHWSSPTPIPEKLAKMKIGSCSPNLPCHVVFSGLDSSVASEIEMEFALAGYTVISNSKNYRTHPSVPILIPEVNSDHLRLLSHQHFNNGVILTNPNCSVTGIALALKPLADLWGIESAHIVTLQALSGAGYPGVPSLDILDNIIPYIQGEESKIESESLKVLGTYSEDHITPYPMKLSAQSNRIPISNGHLACISVKLKREASEDEIISSWKTFQGEPQKLQLPMAPKNPLYYFEKENYPQPKLHRDFDKGMAVSIGRLRKCPLLDWKFILLSHNTIRGAAGGAILNAELMVKKGMLSPNQKETLISLQNFSI